MKHQYKHVLTSALVTLVSLTSLTAKDSNIGLWDAINEGDEVRAKFWIKEGEANVEHRNEDGLTPLSYAAEHEDLFMAMLLLEHGANTEGSPIAGEQRATPLHRAVRNDDGFMIEQLTQRGADTNAVFIWEGREATPLVIAEELGNETAASALLLGNNPSDVDQALRLAVQYGFDEAAGALLQYNDIDVEGGIAHLATGRTLLQVAVDNNDSFMAERLLAAGANIHAVTMTVNDNGDAYGMTALLIALQNGHYAMAERLIHHGANVNLTLRIAVMNGFDEIVGLLINADQIETDIEGGITNGGQGRTLLQVAARNNDTFMVERLLAAGANIHAVTTISNTNGGNIRVTALLIAAETHNDDVADTLIQHGAYANIDGLSPLELAVLGGMDNALDYFLQNGANPDDIEGPRTLLQLAAIRGNVDAIELLLDAEVNIDEQEPEMHQTALHFAIEHNRQTAINTLILEEADLNVQDRTGNTPLHLAVELNNEGAVIALLNAGADPFIRNNDENIPGDVAENLGHATISNLLEEVEQRIQQRALANEVAQMIANAFEAQQAVAPPAMSAPAA